MIRNEIKEEREQAKEVLDFIDDVEGIWDKKKSLHPSQVVSLDENCSRDIQHPIQQDGDGRQVDGNKEVMEKFHRTSLMKNLQKERE